MRRVGRARLASQVIKRLRHAGIQDARYDAKAFAVRFTAGSDDVPTVVPLDALPVKHSRRQRDLFVDGFLHAPGMPDRWEDVRSLLRPVLRGSVPAAGINAPLRRP